jgi:hypothetical protein
LHQAQEKGAVSQALGGGDRRHQSRHSISSGRRRRQPVSRGKPRAQARSAEALGLLTENAKLNLGC